MVALTLMRGMLVILALTASLFFARFYRRAKDTFFALFSAAFALLAVNWLAVAFLGPTDEARAWAFLVRLLAFALILTAIVLKNVGRRDTPD
jgi:hypothetical protein